MQYREALYLARVVFDPLALSKFKSQIKSCDHVSSHAGFIRILLLGCLIACLVPKKSRKDLFVGAQPSEDLSLCCWLPIARRPKEPISIHSTLWHVRIARPGAVAVAGIEQERKQKILIISRAQRRSLRVDSTTYPSRRVCSAYGLDFIIIPVDPFGTFASPGRHQEQAGAS